MRRFLGIFLTLGLVCVGVVRANEGTVDVFNVVGEPGRCWVASVLQKNYNYKLLVSCRDLLYPAIDAEVFDYAMWVVPTTGKGDPQKLGVLGVGKAEFETGSDFSQVLVTKEGRKKGLVQKMGPVVMRGFLQPIKFLDTGRSEQPTPIPSIVPVAGTTSTSISGLTRGVQLGSMILRVVAVAFVLGIGVVVIVLIVSSLGSKRNPPPGL